MMCTVPGSTNGLLQIGRTALDSGRERLGSSAILLQLDDMHVFCDYATVLCS